MAEGDTGKAGAGEQSEAVRGGAPDAKRLKALADGFTDQAAALRRRAARNIISIVATVILMTVLVLALPPLVNVVEDRILAYFGYQTSQVDFQRETARQAADVRARSQRLLNLLRQRDETIAAMQEAVSQPLGAFAPEFLEAPDWADQPIVVDVAEVGDLQVAVGQLSRSYEGASPLIAFRKRGDDFWSTRGKTEQGVTGRLTDAAVLGDTVLVAGNMRDRSGLWRIGKDLLVTPVFEASGSNEENMKVAVSQDGAAFAILEGRGIGLYRSNGEKISQRNILLGNAYDMIWRGDDLFVLTDQVGYAPEVLVYADASGPPTSPGRVKLGGDSPLGFAPERSWGEGAAVFAIAGKSRLRRFEWDRNRDWRADGLIDGAELGNVNRDGPPVFHDFGEEFLFSGAEPPGLVRITTDRRGPTSTPIPLRSAAFEADAFSIHVFREGKVRLSPYYTSPPQDPAAARVIFYVEADPPEIPKPDPDAELLTFLEGLAPEEGEESIGGDGTAESARLENWDLRFAASIQPALDAVPGHMLLAAAAFEGADKLDELAKTWEVEWVEREKSATILARLRAADKQGSLWRNISSLAARLAVIALLIYLVNIVVNLYRYNMRLAAFYQARGDAIETALASGADLKEMVQGSLIDLALANTPEDVTFGARPVPPTDVIAKTLQELAKARAQ